jgi:hypothetical protein
MSDFPSTLPKPMRDGYGLSPQNNLVRTDMDSGAARQRRRFSQALDMVQVSWQFDLTQMDAFRAWFKTGCNDGAAWFGVSLARGYSQLLEPVQARFVSSGEAAWAAKLVTNRMWQVTAKLELRDAGAV